jgi:hypothetical protein
VFGKKRVGSRLSFERRRREGLFLGSVVARVDGGT